MQVAPQARITENNSQLTTKASNRIMGRLQGAASSSSSRPSKGGSKGGKGNPDTRPGADRLTRTQENHWGGQSFFDDLNDPDALGGIDLGPLEGGDDDKPGDDEHDPDDGEDAGFLQRWNGLFGKHSPLMQGTAKDPLSDDLRKRDTVVWKKMKDRPGHHKRYQARRNEKDKGDKDDREDKDSSNGGGGGYGTGWNPERARNKEATADREVVDKYAGVYH